MDIVKKCSVCKRFRAFHKQGCSGMKVYTKKEKTMGFFIVLRNQVTSLLLALGAFYALGAGWTEYNVPKGEEERLVMEIRPNAPGSAAALLEKHEHHCWMDNHPLGHVDSVVLRDDPYDPYIHTRKPRLIDRALDQATKDKDRNLDRILMFCTDKITKSKKTQPNVKLAF